MPLQNRVDPSGGITKVKDRGTLMGNRGVLHNEKGELIRSWKLKAWITCLVAFKGRKRAVFTPGRYSELFFLDEATALSAGHRPCAECRRKDYTRFKQGWIQANQDRAMEISTGIGKIDAVLHEERISAEGHKITSRDTLGNLPDGVFVLKKGFTSIYLVRNKFLYEWSHGGYISRSEIESDLEVAVLTPRSIVNTLLGGYQPRIHSSISFFERR